MKPKELRELTKDTKIMRRNTIFTATTGIKENMEWKGILWYGNEKTGTALSFELKGIFLN